jgi:hypothetical protein
VKDEPAKGVWAMKSNPVTLRQEADVGDAAVDGLLSGVGAGIAMAVYLVAVNLFGEGLAVLTRFDPNGASPAIGGLLHLAMSGVYGATFGIVSKWIRRFNLPAWLSGLIFGLVLFALAEAFILPTGRSALAGIPIVHFGIAHVIYGLVIGIIINRNSKS